MGGACSTFGGEERRVQGLGGETWGKETTQKTRNKWEEIHLQEVGCEGMDWIDLTQNTDRWQSLVNMVASLRVP